MHPAITHVLKFFKYDHLSEKLQAVSSPFCILAEQVANNAPENQETTVALRKLLEAKDAAVRAVLSLLAVVFLTASAEARPPQAPKLPQVMLPAKAADCGCRPDCYCYGTSKQGQGCGCLDHPHTSADPFQAPTKSSDNGRIPYLPGSASSPCRECDCGCLETGRCNCKNCNTPSKTREVPSLDPKAATDDPLIKCCDGSTHRLSEWKGRPMQYPPIPFATQGVALPSRLGVGGMGGFSVGACRGGG